MEFVFDCRYPRERHPFFQSFLLLMMFMVNFQGNKMAKTKTIQNGFLCFGGQDWWYHNHGHVDFQLMREYAKEHTVLYVNSITTQKPTFGKQGHFLQKLKRKAKSIFRGVQHIENNFWVYSPFSLPVFHIPMMRRVNEFLIKIQVQLIALMLRIKNPFLWVVCPTAGNIALSMKRDRLVYLRTDKYESYPNVQVDTILKYDKLLKENSDLTIIVNQNLYMEEKESCKNAFYLDHGVEVERFSLPIEAVPCPEDIRSIPRPIIGYFGAINAHKLDCCFLERISELVPDFSFVYVGKYSLDFKPLFEKENIWFVGMKDYNEIPYYGQQFDVAIIPWRKSPWTQAANPIKLKEYLALGKPIVSTTAFSEVKNYLEHIYTADSPEDFVQKISQAIKEDTSQKQRHRQERVKDASWKSKARIALNEITN